jgi:hypothetical protein
LRPAGPSSSTWRPATSMDALCKLVADKQADPRRGRPPRDRRPDRGRRSNVRRRGRSCRSPSPRRTAARHRTNDPPSCTSAEATIAASRSVMASTTAWGHSWLAWRERSPSARCSNDSPRRPWPGNPDDLIWHNSVLLMGLPGSPSGWPADSRHPACHPSGSDRRIHRPAREQPPPTNASALGSAAAGCLVRRGIDISGGGRRRGSAD